MEKEVAALRGENRPNIGESVENKHIFNENFQCCMDKPIAIYRKCELKI